MTREHGTALLCALTLGCGMAAARHLSPREALDRADIAIQSRSQALELVDSTSTYYVFSGAGGRGYAVLPADDCSYAVLGYSAEGKFDRHSMPPAMRAWLEYYAGEITYASAAGIAAGNGAPDISRADIKPLVAARWGQDAPYNDSCPEFDGRRAVTGCVATAMAQVMHRQKWPEKGTGQITYEYDRRKYSMDFSSQHFDWADMTDNYNAASTPAQKSAVATLMNACGHSVQMMYSTEASGAYSEMIPYGMITYLGYPNTVQHIQREYYTLPEWEDMIYSELAAGRPVLYDGVTSRREGHEFVCDGYAVGGFFHINWGWDGMSDGYFRLSALNPDIQGTGGSEGAFSYGQGAVTGIQRPGPDTEGIACEPYFISGKGFTVSKPRLMRGESADLFSQAWITNYSYTTSVRCDFGMKLHSADGSWKYIASSKPRSFWSAKYFGYLPGAQGGDYVSSYPIAADSLPEAGIYTATPATRDLLTGAVYDIHVPYYMQREMTIECTPEYVQFTGNYTAPSLVADSVSLGSPLYSGRKCLVNMRLSAAGGEYGGNIMASFTRIVPPEAKKPSPIFSEATFVDVYPGEPQELQLITSVKASVTDTAYYTLVIVDEYSNRISEPVTVMMLPDPGKPAVSVRYRFSTIKPVPQLPMDNISIPFTLSVSSGYLSSPVELAIFGEESIYADMTWSSPMLFVEAGKSKGYTFNVDFGAGIPGKEYYIALYLGNDMISGSLKRIKLLESSGIDLPAADTRGTLAYTPAGSLAYNGDDPLTHLEVLDTSGRVAFGVSHPGEETDATGLPRGVYIARGFTVSGECITIKFAVK